MIETIYRVNGKEFRSEAEAVKYQREINKKGLQKVYCANCKELVGEVDNLEKGTYRINWIGTFVKFSCGGSYNEYEIEPVGKKYLCPQCGYKFEHQLEEYRNLIEKLFDDFNLREPDEKPKNNEMIKSIIDIDDPDSMISKYVEQKNEEAKEWINNMKEEN